MRRRWVVLIRVKRYPYTAPSVIATYDPVLLLLAHEPGPVLAVDSRHFTRWGANWKAAKRNIPPNVLWTATVERAT